jgi:hypothetical protein
VLKELDEKKKALRESEQSLLVFCRASKSTAWLAAQPIFLCHEKKAPHMALSPKAFRHCNTNAPKRCYRDGTSTTTNRTAGVVLGARRKRPMVLSMGIIKRGRLGSQQ